MCEEVEALGGELEDDVPLRRLLQGPLVGSVLQPVEGDLVAPSPAVVGEEAEDGVLLRLLHAFHVSHHVGDVDGILFLPFLCRDAWRGEGGGVPVEPWPCDVGQVVLKGRPILRRGPCWLRWWGGGAAGRWTGVSRAPAGGGGGCGGAFCGPESAGSLAAGSSSGGVGSICCFVSSVCWSSSSRRLSMSRAMGSSLVFTCWGAASWHGGRVMLVLRARAAAGAGS